MERENCLKKAIEIVTNDRNKMYGLPEDNFNEIAQYWSVYLRADITAADVAKMMILFKIARLNSCLHEDGWVDIAGYAACGSECSKSQD